MGGYNALRQRYYSSNSSIAKRYFSFLNRGFQHEFGAYLPFEFQLQGPMNLPHGAYGIFISGGSSIGKNCTIFQQVTIGSNMLIDSKKLGSPRIGDNCLIGAGAKVIGNISIGNNCRISANAVVMQDMPDNSVCIQGGQHFIQKDNLINHNYQYREEGWGYMENGGFVPETDPDRLTKLNELI
jgi:serine O-acetyltransferase